MVTSQTRQVFQSHVHACLNRFEARHIGPEVRNLRAVAAGSCCDGSSHALLRVALPAYSCFSASAIPHARAMRAASLDLASAAGVLVGQLPNVPNTPCESLARRVPLRTTGR